MSWLSFVRHYGPIPRNDNMYDEQIQRSARRQKMEPIEFEHPMQDVILQCFDQRTTDPVSVILTGVNADEEQQLHQIQHQFEVLLAQHRRLGIAAASRALWKSLERERTHE
jgi:hypothetical protein